MMTFINVEHSQFLKLHVILRNRCIIICHGAEIKLFLIIKYSSRLLSLIQSHTIYRGEWKKLFNTSVDLRTHKTRYTNRDYHELLQCEKLLQTGKIIMVERLTKNSENFLRV